MPQEKGQQAKERICQISTVHPPIDVRIFYRECSSLVEAGYEVNLVIPCEQSCTKNGVHLHTIPRVKNRILRMLFMPWVAMNKALKTKSSIYHYHDPELLLMGFVLRWVFGKKVVFDIHESVPRQILGKEYIPKFARKAFSIIYMIFERVLTIGQNVIVANFKSVEELWKVPYLVQNYPLLDEELMAGVEEEKPRAKVPLLVFVGVLSKDRGADACVELAGKLAERGHDFRMKFIGRNHNNCVERLTARVAELNLQDKIVFRGLLKWPQAMRETAEGTIGLCLLLPVPNNLILLSTKIIEYMMLGVPVLTSNFDTWQPYVEGEGTGMMADPMNIEEVADVCEQMLSDPDELAAMRKRGIEAVRTKYNWNTEFGVLCQCYEDLLKKKE